MQFRRGGSFTIPELVTLILFVSFFLLGMPLDGQLGRSGGTASSLIKGQGTKGLEVAIVWGSLYLIAFWVFFRNLQNLRTVLNATPYAILLIVFLALSILWSTQPFIGILSIFQLIGSATISFVIALYYRDNPDKFIRHTALSLGAAQLLSTVFILLEPSLGIGPTGRWTGVYGAPNYFGALAFCSLWANVAVIFILKQTRAYVFILFAVISAANLLGSNSVTSVASSIMALGIMLVWSPIIGHERGITLTRLIISTTLILFVFGILLNMVDPVIEYLFSFSGRSMSMSGRTEIWSEAFVAIAQNPFIGSGFGTELELKSIRRLTDLHSSYITILYNGGIVAFSLLLMVIYRAIYATLGLRKQYAQTAHILGPMLLAILLYNLAESSLLNPRSPIFFLFFTIIVLVQVLKIYSLDSEN